MQSSFNSGTGMSYLAARVCRSLDTLRWQPATMPAHLQSAPSAPLLARVSTGLEAGMGLAAHRVGMSADSNVLVVLPPCGRAPPDAAEARRP